MPREIKEKCSHCDGKGYFMSGCYSRTSTPKTVTCPKCDGKKNIIKEILYTESELQEIIQQEREEYNELIMAVYSKYYGETRHQTALRYINNGEIRSEHNSEWTKNVNKS